MALSDTEAIPLSHQSYGVQLPYAELSHSFGFKSAYKQVTGSEPKFTNCNGSPPPGFVGTLDYIFYSGGITPVSIMDLPSLEECMHEGGNLPNR